MYNGQKINELIGKSGLKKTEFLAQLNMQYKSLQTIIEGNPTVKSLERIADFFKVPMDYFFDRNNPGNITSIGHQITGDGNRVTGDIGLSECHKEIEHLRQLLAAKEETIETQRELIKSLKK